MDDSGLPPARRLWERIEAERNSRGWTTLELEERSGVDRSTVHRWQSAKRAPLADSVVRIADALGVPRNDLLQLAGHAALSDVEPVAAPSIGDVEGDAETEALLARLPESRRRRLEEFRESERRRLQRMVQDVAREASVANERFAEFVRQEANDPDLS
ncbi:helix-turn-helix domain-containing protein [Nonomuraea sp. NPDC050328]|uniref:helix-turn-helix domain-containing protein n=1 Tax=Nonomuraea sp. NPDC050328 TaxID=3364361 RepID=UPI003798A4F5